MHNRVFVISERITLWEWRNRISTYHTSYICDFHNVDIYIMFILQSKNIYDNTLASGVHPIVLMMENCVTVRMLLLLFAIQNMLIY